MRQDIGVQCTCLFKAAQCEPDRTPMEKPSLLFLLGFRCHFLRVSAAIGGNASGALGHALCKAIGYLLSRESRRDPIVREMSARRGSTTLRLP